MLYRMQWSPIYTENFLSKCPPIDPSLKAYLLKAPRICIVPNVILAITETGLGDRRQNTAKTERRPRTKKAAGYTESAFVQLPAKLAMVLQQAFNYTVRFQNRHPARFMSLIFCLLYLTFLFGFDKLDWLIHWSFHSDSSFGYWLFSHFFQIFSFMIWLAFRAISVNALQQLPQICSARARLDASSPDFRETVAVTGRFAAGSR